MRHARKRNHIFVKKLYSNTPPGNLRDIITEGKRSVISYLEVRIDFLMFFTYIYAFYVETDYGRNLILVFIWQSNALPDSNSM